MNFGGQEQTVPQEILHKKLGRKLIKNDEFETPVGRWRVVAICKDGNDTYTIEKIG